MNTVDAIFDQGVFRPLQPLDLREGTRVHLTFDETDASQVELNVSQILSPRLVHPHEAQDFAMELVE